MHSRLRHSIGTKVFVAFFAMGVIIGALGAYGYRVLSTAGDMVTGTYDGPLMAINYARAASVDFVQMEQAVLRRKLAMKGEHAAIDKQIDELTDTFFSDLDVAQERLEAADERAVAAQIRGLVKTWQETWRKSEHEGSDPALDALDKRILNRFDMLVELNADHSFVRRRKAVWAIGYFKYALVAVTGLALLLAFGITLFLARRIMRPLSSAVLAADRIAQGELDAPIPKAGEDETGILLKSMTVMQDNIREMVAREKERAVSAEGRLAQAMETSGEGVILIDRDGRIVLANNIMRDFFPGIGSALVKGADFAAISRRECALPTPQSLGSEEHQLKDGRWIRSSGSRNPDGSLIFFVSDFTAVKEREENMRRAQQAAETASAAKSRFLANMSHELRTPLNAIIGFSEILSGQIFGALGSPRYLEYAIDIQRSGRHLLGVINSVLEISKSESGKQSLTAEPVDLCLVLRDCAKMVAEQCEAAKIAFHFDEPADPVIVSGEKAKLRQVFLNLLSNAMKFTDAGGSVTVSVLQGNDDIVVEIADAGIGMSPDQIEVALTPFGQVDNRLERKYEGAGLGLSLAKSFVELHGGRLTIESSLGRGTTVRVHFFKAKAAESPLAAVS